MCHSHTHTHTPQPYIIPHPTLTLSHYLFACRRHILTQFAAHAKQREAATHKATQTFEIPL